MKVDRVLTELAEAKSRRSSDNQINRSNLVDRVVTEASKVDELTELTELTAARCFTGLVFWIRVLLTRVQVDIWRGLTVDKLGLTGFDWLWVVSAVLRLAHIQGGLGRHHQYPPTQERADTGQWQGLRSLFIRSDIGKSVCERVRVRTRARF